MNKPQIRVLSKSKPIPSVVDDQSTFESKSPIVDLTETKKCIDLSAFQLKHESEAKTFKLIDEKDWNFIQVEPSSESQFLNDGHPLMSVVSIIGPTGVGKSSLLNKIAHKYAFETHGNGPSSSRRGGSPSKIHTKHLTRGVDIHVTHHRILLDCQPLLSHSVLEDFLSGHSSPQFGRDIANISPYTSSHMISLQLTAFLIATCDYVVIMNKWLIDNDLLQLIASALMMLGENSYKAKLIMFCQDKAICERRFKDLTNSCLGMNQVERYFCEERELINYVSSYTGVKCEQLTKDPTGLRGRKWLGYARKLWSQTIKSSSLFADYALELHRSNNPS